MEICAYAGTGNVFKIQQLLHICSHHYEQDKQVVDKSKDKKKDDKKEGEKEKEEKQEDTPSSPSLNPQLPILDTLSKFSHDTDAEVTHNAIFGLGLI